MPAILGGMPTPAVTFDHVVKSFGRNVVLKDICEEVASGETVVIIGPSGSGKSTLLRTVNRLESIDSGAVLVNGVSVHAKETDVNALRSHVGMVQQAFNLFTNDVGITQTLQDIELNFTDGVELLKASLWFQSFCQRHQQIFSRTGH